MSRKLYFGSRKKKKEGSFKFEKRVSQNAVATGKIKPPSTRKRHVKFS